MQLRQVNIWREEQAGKGPGSEMRVGDVRALLPGLIEQYASQAQVVYLDPPFRTGQVFSMRARVGEKEWKSGAGSDREPRRPTLLCAIITRRLTSDSRPTPSTVLR